MAVHNDAAVHQDVVEEEERLQRLLLTALLQQPAFPHQNPTRNGQRHPRSSEGALHLPDTFTVLMLSCELIHHGGDVETCLLGE